MTRPANIVPLLLAIAGTAVAGYLTYVHYNQGALVCGIGDCHIVQASKYSEMFGIPIAIFGLLTYLAIVALLVVRSTMAHLADVANTGIMVLLLASTVYFAYLTYLEIWVIRAICQWCVAVAIITVILLLVEGVRMTREFRSDDPDFAFDEE